MEQQIEINGKKYNLKYSIRSLFIFEQITKKSFKIETMLDNYVFFYSIILASNKDNPLDWDEFIDAVDSDPNLMVRMNDIVNAQIKQNEVFNSDEEEEEKKDGAKKKKLSISEMYALLVLKYHMSPQYVLDEMQPYELNALMKYGYMANSEQWEQARLVAYMTAQVNSKRKLKFSDICEFPWEKENTEKNTAITKQDIERMKHKAQKYLEQHGGHCN